MQKRTEITIETERLLVINQRHERVGLWCGHCATTLPMLTVDVASRIAGVTALEIFRLMESGKIHTGITREGRLFVCPNSIAFQLPDKSSSNEPNIHSTF